MVTRSASEELGYIRRGDRLMAVRKCLADKGGLRSGVAAGDLLPLVLRELETAMHQRKRTRETRTSIIHRSSLVDISLPTPNGSTPRVSSGYVIERLPNSRAGHRQIRTASPAETKRNCSRHRLGHGHRFLVAFVQEYRYPCPHLHDVKLVIPVTCEALDLSTGRTRHLGFRAPNGDLVHEVGPLIQDDTIRITIRTSCINGQQEFN